MFRWWTLCCVHSLRHLRWSCSSWLRLVEPNRSFHLLLSIFAVQSQPVCWCETVSNFWKHQSAVPITCFPLATAAGSASLTWRHSPSLASAVVPEDALFLRAKHLETATLTGCHHQHHHLQYHWLVLRWQSSLRRESCLATVFQCRPRELKGG